MEYLFSIQSKAIFRKLLEALDIIGQQQYGHARVITAANCALILCISGVVSANRSISQASTAQRSAAATKV